MIRFRYLLSGRQGSEPKANCIRQSRTVPRRTNAYYRKFAIDPQLILHRAQKVPMLLISGPIPGSAHQTTPFRHKDHFPQVPVDFLTFKILQPARHNLPTEKVAAPILLDQLCRYHR